MAPIPMASQIKTQTFIHTVKNHAAKIKCLLLLMNKRFDLLYI